MKNIIINGRPYITNKNMNIINICQQLNFNIPRFCYSEKLKIAGNCRACLIELKKSIKPIASCAMKFLNYMSIELNSLYIKKIRENILEFILKNHPLDCPICDQGGECDLQEEAKVFGSDRGRYFQNKIAKNDFNIPFIKTIMTRCISCTRCVRFLPSYLGTLGRASSTNISNYFSYQYSSNFYSINAAFLCPVASFLPFDQN